MFKTKGSTVRLMFSLVMMHEHSQVHCLHMQRQSVITRYNGTAFFESPIHPRSQVSQVLEDLRRSTSLPAFAASQEATSSLSFHLMGSSSLIPPGPVQSSVAMHQRLPPHFDHRIPVMRAAGTIHNLGEKWIEDL
jgi:hypothetical protein